MRILLPTLFFALAGCSTVWDPHAPGTTEAPENGGEVKVSHGNRLLVRLRWRHSSPCAGASR